MSKVRTNFKAPKPGHFVKEWRKYRGLTQDELAEALGVTQSAIGQLERGIVNYTQPMLEAIAAELFCTPGELVERDPLDDTSIWKIHSQFAEATPEQRRQAILVVSTLLKAG